MKRALTFLCVAGASITPAYAGPTLDKVHAAGALACGVIAEPEDYNKTDLHASIAPLATEICKAVAVATLGQKAEVAVKAYAVEDEAEQGLHAGEVDLVVGVSPDATVAWHYQLGFGPPVFYDGLGFLVRGDANATKLADLAGAKVCVIEGTDNEKILLSRTVDRGIAVVPLPFQEEGEMEDGTAVRHCDAISADLTRLAYAQSNYPKQLGRDVVLPDLLTLAPIAPAYRQGDAQWAAIVDWTIHALVQAEASGVTQANVAAETKSSDPVVQRLLGVDWATSRALDLPAHDWAAQVITVVGNYGEIYDRTMGVHGKFNMPRGMNALWTQGGLMHPLPVQ